jgi:hypothetical protein
MNEAKGKGGEWQKKEHNGKAFGTCGPCEFLKARNPIPLRSNKRRFQGTALQIQGKTVLTLYNISLFT